MASISALLFFLPLVAVIAFFVVSLVLYCVAKSKNKRMPGSVSKEVLESRKVMLIVSGVIAGVFIAVIVGFIMLLANAVAFM